MRGSTWHHFMGEQLAAMQEKSCRCPKLTQLENGAITTIPSHHTYIIWKAHNTLVEHIISHTYMYTQRSIGKYNPDRAKKQGAYPTGTGGWYGMAACTHNSNKDSTSLRLQIPLLMCWPPALWCRGGWLDFGGTFLLASRHTQHGILGPTIQLQLDICKIE